MKIEHLIYINDCWLCVFYTDGSCWQYSILFPDLSFYSPEEIYYTSDAAFRMGCDAIAHSPR
ncbi:hypothetical protein [Hyella patelloides]|uniref:hypothetical protein n=1 Tax=Hyella patelloides TaxID=1982969 RepID=UPI0011A08AE0|nr:hypothetical protein [Hyella patelloides]